MIEYIRFTRDGDVGIITLDDPQRGNAITLALADQLRTAVQKCSIDRSIRAVVLNATGKVFCAGGDIAEFQRKRGERAVALEAIAARFHEAERKLLELDVPLITVIQGAAAGAGLALALLGDIVIASEQARFVPGFAMLGVSADGGSTWLLPRLIGQRRATEWLLTGRSLAASEAMAWGLVSELCQAAELADRASTMAQQLATGPTPALGSIKRLLRCSLHSDFSEQTQCEAQAILHHAETINGEEGVRAFLERRAPRFAGHNCDE